MNFSITINPLTVVGLLLIGTGVWEGPLVTPAGPASVFFGSALTAVIGFILVVLSALTEVRFKDCL